MFKAYENIKGLDDQLLKKVMDDLAETKDKSMQEMFKWCLVSML